MSCYDKRHDLREQEGKRFKTLEQNAVRNYGSITLMRAAELDAAAKGKLLIHPWEQSNRGAKRKF